MNTKILAAVFALGIATTLGACGGSSEPAASPSAPASPADAMSPSPSPSK
jgi:ABC-type glycerol-3-phosphate transport system substrate-binding protein